MKKLIIIAMVLVITRPQVATSCVSWPYCDNMGEVLWEFTEDGCMPTSDEYDPAYCYWPDLADPTFGTRYLDDGPVWPWADGKFTVEDAGGGTEDSLNQPIPDSDGRQYMRMYFEVVHTLVESEDPSLIGMALELWDMGDWLGCPDNSEATGEYGGGYEFPAPTSTEDLGGGWYKSIWVADFSTDGSVYMPGFEGYEFPDLYEATHTNAIIGMADHGATGFLIDEVHIMMVWHNYTEGYELDELEYCSCLGIIIPPPPPEPPLEFDPNFSVLYEPYDPETMGPPTPGPTSGTVGVRLKWQPEEPDDVYVIINPDPNNEVTPNPDLILPASTEPNGVVRLIFNQSNYNVWQTVVFKAVKDLEKEGNESHLVSFSTQTNGDPNFDGYETRRGSIVIDNDIPYIVGIPYRIEVSENDPCTVVCFNVRLSHLPTADVKILVAKDGLAAEEGMFKITPPLGITDEPNYLAFTVNPAQAWDPCTMTSGFNVEQTICVNAVDNDELAEAWEEIIDGEIILTGQSEDEWYNDAGFGGELATKGVDVEVQDNDCGAWGYDHRDVNEDCYVNLGDFAMFYTQWLFCTEPYDGAMEYPPVPSVCDKLWNLLEEE